jgi:hypothetical protein
MGFAFVQVWNVVGVLNYLQALIEEKNANFTFTATDGYDYYGGTNVLKSTGLLQYCWFAACALLVGGLSKWSLCTFTR